MLVRGPCPFLNTFANHGFLPRSGKYITEEDLVSGLADSVNFGEDLTRPLFDFAITTNPEPNSTWFSLDHLAATTSWSTMRASRRFNPYFHNL